MLATKCINGKILHLTKNKRDLLDNEYSQFDSLCKFLSEANSYGVDEYCEYKFVKDKFKIYSLTKTQAIRNCLKSKNEHADYNACLNIIKRSLGYILNDGAIAYTRNSRLT